MPHRTKQTLTGVALELLEAAMGVGGQNRDEVPVTRAGSPTLMNLSATALILGYLHL